MTNRTSSTRIFGVSAWGLALPVVILLATTAGLSLIVIQLTSPDPDVYTPPREVASGASDTPEERERAFPAGLSSEIWLGMSRVDVESTANRHTWGIQAATNNTENVARREFPLLPETSTWFTVCREGASGSIDVGFANDVLIYKNTRGSLRGTHTDLPEVAPEYGRTHH